MSCASPIRDMLVALGIDRAATEGTRKNDPIDWLNYRTSRMMLKSLGTEWGRTYVGEDIWINSILRQASKSKVPIICDDCRFDNEVRAIKEAGGHLMYVNRPCCEYTWEHPSECGLSNWDDVSAVIGLSSATVICRPLAEELFPIRPWWANWRLGQLMACYWHKKFPRPGPGTNLHRATEIASEVVRVWNKLTLNEVALYARK